MLLRLMASICDDLFLFSSVEIVLIFRRITATVWITAFTCISCNFFIETVLNTNRGWKKNHTTFQWNATQNAVNAVIVFCFLLRYFVLKNQDGRAFLFSRQKTNHGGRASGSFPCLQDQVEMTKLTKRIKIMETAKMWIDACGKSLWLWFVRGLLTVSVIV